MNVSTFISLSKCLLHNESDALPFPLGWLAYVPSPWVLGACVFSSHWTCWKWCGVTFKARISKTCSFYLAFTRQTLASSHCPEEAQWSPSRHRNRPHGREQKPVWQPASVPDIWTNMWGLRWRQPAAHMSQLRPQPSRNRDRLSLLGPVQTPESQNLYTSASCSDLSLSIEPRRVYKSGENCTQYFEYQNMGILYIFHGLALNITSSIKIIPNYQNRIKKQICWALNPRQVLSGSISLHYLI